MEYTHEDVVHIASTSHERAVRFDPPILIEDGAYMNFYTTHPGFAWCNPNRTQSAPPSFIVDGNTGEVDNRHCLRRVSAIGDGDLLPWLTVENDGTCAWTEGFTLTCDADLLRSDLGLWELQQFLQACLGEGMHVAVKNFTFRH